MLCDINRKSEIQDDGLMVGFTTSGLVAQHSGYLHLVAGPRAVCESLGPSPESSRESQGPSLESSPESLGAVTRVESRVRRLGPSLESSRVTSRVASRVNSRY